MVVAVVVLLIKTMITVQTGQGRRKGSGQTSNKKNQDGRSETAI